MAGASPPLPLVGLRNDDVIPAATVSMTSEDASYPATNAQTDDPADVAKSTGNSTTFTITTSSIVPVILALINTNATTVTFEGSSVTMPSAEEDGQRLHPWKDLTIAPPAADTSWSLALSRASGVVWVGRIVLLTASQDLNLKYGLQRGRNRPGVIVIETRLGSKIIHDAEIRTRWATGVVDRYQDESMLHELEAAASGIANPFLFIPDEAVNDAWWVRFRANDFKSAVADIGTIEIPLAFDEVSSGPPNG